MSDAGYVVAGWSVSLGALGAYGVWLAVRTRRALQRLPEEDRERFR